MELTAQLRPTVATSMAPAPNLLLYCKLLALGRFDLDRAIADELADNPASSVDEPAACPRFGRPATGTDCRGCSKAARASLQLPQPQLAEDDRDVASLVVGGHDARGFLGQF